MKVLVTGGGGFVGSAVCRMLVARGDEVFALNRSRYPDLAAYGVAQIAGDVRDGEVVLAAVRGCDAVVHCAAAAGIWGPARLYEEVNVGGTVNVLKACLRARVGRLVHTSSPSVVFDGRDLDGVDESVPYARRFLAHYPRTKAIAERLVLGANSDLLGTVALRPHLVWGPGDPHFLPRLMKAARRGTFALPRAPGKRIDAVYVDNAAEAHLLALDAIAPGSDVSGRAYFIGQGEPITHDRWVNALLAAAGMPAVTRRVPAWSAHMAARAVEGAYRVARVRAEPPITRLLVRQATTAHWFDLSAARHDLGYVPRVGMIEGMKRLQEHLSA
ncbi:NAD-dependent epimerase/dehydratase family protein [Nonomuraea insulae]|uniref:NAD-dependent epimerase/dehydratase family protein n=1 Tax=Nonomuraea insulae TaxID=1616787 RepID=A0ABW1CI22_9ACTN